MYLESKACSKLSFYFSLILVIYLLSKASALYMEKIIGGYFAYMHNFRYQVSVQSCQYYENDYYAICGGAIIADNFVLSAAHCFIDSEGDLALVKFRIVAGSTNLVHNVGIRIDIDQIFIPGFEPTFNTYDIAVVKLVTGFSTYSNHIISTLKLPYHDISLANKVAVVSGYGYDWIKVNRKLEYTIEGSSNFLLKYAIVRILNPHDCKRNRPMVNFVTQLCGLMYTDHPIQEWGICTGDSGAPLVINNIIIGIASKSTPICKDTVTAALYTNIMTYASFIEPILAGNVPTYTLSYKVQSYSMDELLEAYNALD